MLQAMILSLPETPSWELITVQLIHSDRLTPDIISTRRTDAPRRKLAARWPSRRPAKEAVVEPNAGEEEAKGPLVGAAPSQMINVDTAKRRDTG